MIRTVLFRRLGSGFTGGLGAEFDQGRVVLLGGSFLAMAVVKHSALVSQGPQATAKTAPDQPTIPPDPGLGHARGGSAASLAPPGLISARRIHSKL